MSPIEQCESKYYGGLRLLCTYYDYDDMKAREEHMMDAKS